MSTVIESIIAGVKEDIAEREAKVSLDEIKRLAQKQTSSRDVISLLKRPHAPRLQVFAEVKRSSPSKGFLATIDNPADIARKYQIGGASVVSCLTEKRRFNGSLEDFDAVRKAVDLPILRKDFIVTSYQIWEARAHGADIVILMVSAIEQNALVSLIERTRSLGMEALVEAHTREEAYRALEAGARIIGVNARNLKTLEVDREVVPQVLDVIPEHIFKVAESGVRCVKDALDYANAGADAVLVGEALVKDNNPQETVSKMIAWGQHPCWR